MATVLRQNATDRMSFADSTGPADASESVRHSAAHRAAIALRVLSAPLVLAAVAVGGAIFLILLPVCGIASIAEGVAREGWRFLRVTFRSVVPHVRRG
jgi:energy-coupling factor transporter transmembrane protein EcfT